MKKILVLIIVVAASIYQFIQEQGFKLPDGFIQSDNSDAKSQKQKTNLLTAFNNKRSNLQIQDEGLVIKVLADDLDGSRHQKFILKNKNGQTVLIAHNIDLAPRINGIREGDKVEFYGEYEWNSRGGIIHWTHKDLKGYHEGGWLKHRGKIYQ